ESHDRDRPGESRDVWPLQRRDRPPSPDRSSLRPPCCLPRAARESAAGSAHWRDPPGGPQSRSALARESLPAPPRSPETRSVPALQKEADSGWRIVRKEAPAALWSPVSASRRAPSIASNYCAADAA